MRPQSTNITKNIAKHGGLLALILLAVVGWGRDWLNNESGKIQKNTDAIHKIDTKVTLTCKDIEYIKEKVDEIKIHLDKLNDRLIIGRLSMEIK